MINKLSNLPQAVQDAGQLKIRGSKLDDSWFNYLTFTNGKPHMLAILILSEIYYWYTPTEVKDEETGNSMGHKKKFKADKLQRSFQALGDRFGFSKRQATEACHYLENKKLITIDYRTIRLGEVVLNNVTFFEPNIENIKKISSMYEDESERNTLSRSDARGSNIQKEDLSHSNVRPITFECETNTLTTTGTSTEINNTATAEEKNSDLTIDAGSFNFPIIKVDPAMGRLIKIFEQELGRPITAMESENIGKMYDEIGEPLTIEILREGVKAGIRTFRYFDSILIDWKKNGIRTLIELEEHRKKHKDNPKKWDNKINKNAKEMEESSEPKKSKYDNFYI